MCLYMHAAEHNIHGRVDYGHCDVLRGIPPLILCVYFSLEKGPGSIADGRRYVCMRGTRLGAGECDGTSDQTRWSVVCGGAAVL